MAEKIFFAKCKTKGCKSGHPFRAESAVSYGHIVPVMPWGSSVAKFAYIDPQNKGSAYWDAAVAAGWVCDEHGTMYVEPVKAHWVPSIKCDGRCENAKRPQCDCSCNGQNHGVKSANF